VFVGMVPEGISMSPDGRFVAAAVQNGAHLSPASPLHHPTGILKVYALAGARLTYVTEAPIGRWAQGIAWNRQGTIVLVQAAQDKTVAVFKFDGRALTKMASIAVDGAPTGIRTAQQRSSGARATSGAR
jgi:DNA-binding beta-propeller fold protein YncE